MRSQILMGAWETSKPACLQSNQLTLARSQSYTNKNCQWEQMFIALFILVHFLTKCFYIYFNQISWSWDKVSYWSSPNSNSETLKLTDELSFGEHLVSMNGNGNKSAFAVITQTCPPSWRRLYRTRHTTALSPRRHRGHFITWYHWGQSVIWGHNRNHRLDRWKCQLHPDFWRE